MGRIRVLPDALIDRIAAGEVVERPASVVKELVENSLDAGSRSIEVLLFDGGRQLVRVSDDGCGMDRDDALLALERHATSKLTRAEDLHSIATLGFRGEALSSIAAVSQLRLETAREDGEGTVVDVRGGRIREVLRAGLARGTSVQVERLFHNVPARRKFLRSEPTELGHVVRWLTRYALVRPQVKIVVKQGERRLIDAAPTSSDLDRIAQLFGAEFSGKLLPFERVQDGMRARGFAGRPVDGLPRRETQHLFVNGRAVQDRLLLHAVSQAYGNTMAFGRHPALFLFLELDPGDVDVNVHPQKVEVRFQRPSELHTLVREALGSALAHPRAVPALTDLRPRTPELAGVQDATLRYFETCEPAMRRPHVDGARAASSAAERPATGPLALATGTRPLAETGAGHATALTQFRDSYILAEDEAGLVLVDQHAAHERVLFERYLAQAEENRVEVQRLLFPLTLELAPHERLVLEQEQEELERLGFGVEPFGGTAVRLDGVPALAAEVDAEGLLRELLGEAARAKAAASDVPRLRRQLVTSAACQAAIKIHHPLPLPAMQALLDDLSAAGNPTTCPHGRPTLFRLTLEEIERAFRRR